jgi:hypothetical protein
MSVPARTIGGYCAYCPLRWCKARHGDRSSFTTEHIAGGDHLRSLFDGAMIGFSGLKDLRPIQSAMYRPSSGPTAAAMR